MKLPSLNYLIENAKDSAKRFPLSLISALLAVAIAIYLFEEHDNIKNLFPGVNIMLCGALGIPLFFCAKVIGIKRSFSLKNQSLLNLGCGIILVLIYLSLPNKDITQNTAQPYIKYGIYNLIIHLLVAVVPFLGPGEINGFWNYNKSLFLRFITSALYSGFLFAGLALAMVALHLLFDIKIHEELYVELWIFIAGFANTWFFLSGIPKNFDELDTITSYPKGLKVFAQYILLPLLSLYLIILYVYGGKILILWDWPKGIVSYLIICVAVLGILNLLLLYPYAKSEENSWIGKWSKAYYFVLLPLTVILFIAISMRLEDYGITVKRYVVFLLGVWLVIVCVYNILGKKNLKFIPASLAVMLALMSFGPWGMFSVGERSQEHRLEKILQESGILKNGKVKNGLAFNDSTFSNSLNPKTDNDGLLTDSLHNEVRSIIMYLDDFHGYSGIRDWFGQDIDSLVTRYKDLDKEKYRWFNEWELYMYALGLDPAYIPEKENDNYYYSYSAIKQNAIALRDFEYQVPFNLRGNEVRGAKSNDTLTFSLEGKDFILSLDAEKLHQLSLISGRDTLALPLADLAFKLSSFYSNHYQNGLATKEMQLTKLDGKRTLELTITDFSFDRKKDSLNLNAVEGYLLLKGVR